MTMPKVVIIIAAHREYEFPDDKGYMPLHVGKTLNPQNYGFQGDNTGDNISELNNWFCELTGHYWLWKNQAADYYGLAHYRRYFKPIDDYSVTVKDTSIISSRDLLKLMNNYDVILPKKRCYFIDTIRTHYNHAHYSSDLEALQLIIADKHKDYIESFDEVMNSRCISLYNMFIMRRELFIEYSNWLFCILFELEKCVPYKQYGNYQRRIFGFLSERLLNIWIKKHSKAMKVKYLPVANIEGDNYMLKIIGFLRRKVFGKNID